MIPFLQARDRCRLFVRCGGVRGRVLWTGLGEKRGGLKLLVQVDLRLELLTSMADKVAMLQPTN